MDGAQGGPQGLRLDGAEQLNSKKIGSSAELAIPGLTGDLLQIQALRIAPVREEL